MQYDLWTLGSVHLLIYAEFFRQCRSIMAEANQEIIYECSKCFSLLPYKSCFHSCPGQDAEEDEEDGFHENLGDWYQEVKKKKEEGWQVQVAGDEEYTLDAPVVMILPNQPGRRYLENIQGHDLDGSWHLRRQGEEVPEGVEPIRMVEVGPGEYRRLADLEMVEMEVRMARVSLEDKEEQPRFEDLFEEFRKPFP